MTITIPNELDDFVRAKLHDGGFESPAAVVTAALAAWQGQEAEELKSSLLAAVGKPTRQYRKGEFIELARRAISEDCGS